MKHLKISEKRKNKKNEKSVDKQNEIIYNKTCC